jgi:hypothetical protein
MLGNIAIYAKKSYLEVRMDPYLSGEKRQEMIAAILRE